MIETKEVKAKVRNALHQFHETAAANRKLSLLEIKSLLAALPQRQETDALGNTQIVYEVTADFILKVAPNFDTSVQRIQKENHLYSLALEVENDTWDDANMALIEYRITKDGEVLNTDGGHREALTLVYPNRKFYFRIVMKQTDQSRTDLIHSVRTSTSVLSVTKADQRHRNGITSAEQTALTLFLGPRIRTGMTPPRTKLQIETLMASLAPAFKALAQAVQPQIESWLTQENFTTELSMYGNGTIPAILAALYTFRELRGQQALDDMIQAMLVADAASPFTIVKKCFVALRGSKGSTVSYGFFLAMSNALLLAETKTTATEKAMLKIAKSTTLSVWNKNVPSGAAYYSAGEEAVPTKTMVA